MKLLRPFVILLATTFLSVYVVACSAGRNDRATVLGDTLPVDPLFRQFHAQLGGEKTLGPAITPVFEQNGIIYQYTVGSLMMYDPQSPPDQHFKLGPLGLDLGISEAPVSRPEREDVLYVAGHVIYDKFKSLYNQMGGQEVVGAPLTEAYHNHEKERVEQYFENVGFYWIEGDETDAIYLLAFGTWKCGEHCAVEPSDSARIAIPSKRAEPFVKASARLGLEFTGYALTEPYFSKDGQLQQIYENVVFAIRPENPEIVRLIPVPEKIGYIHDPLKPSSHTPDLYFYPVQGEMGYEIPLYIMDYIKKHGGLDFIGAPITQQISFDDNLSRQCFENLCLEAQPGGSGIMEVRPIPLGEEYRDLFFNPLEIETGPQMGSPLDITIQIWEGYPLVSPDQQQEVGVVVYANRQPLPGVEPVLELTLPNGDHQTLRLPATDESGESQIRIEPLEAPNGSLIPYKVCVDAQTEQNFCVMDSYLIWQSDFITVTPAVTPDHMSYLPFVLKNFNVYIPAIADQFKSYLPVIFKGE